MLFNACGWKTVPNNEKDGYRSKSDSHSVNPVENGTETSQKSPKKPGENGRKWRYDMLFSACGWKTVPNNEEDGCRSKMDSHSINPVENGSKTSPKKPAEEARGGLRRYEAGSGWLRDGLTKKTSLALISIRCRAG